MWIQIIRWTLCEFIFLMQIHTSYEFILVMWIHTLYEYLLFMWIHTCEFITMWIHTCEFILCWRDSLFLGAITSLCLWSREGGKNTIRAPLGARAYPWILSKYFLCVRACVRPCMCSPTDKRRVCLFCVKTLNLCGILVVFCSYLECNAITPFSSYVLYWFLHTYFFSCTEVLSM